MEKPGESLIDFRFAIADFRLKGKRQGTQMIMMIMISTYLNHHDHLCSLSQNRTSYTVNRTL
jgi:hypothetical protein